MNDSLVIQSYGSEKEYKRAIFSIWSFYAWSNPSNPIQSILFTDSSLYFKPFIEGLPVKCISLTKEKIEHMRGEIDFVHRVKIAVIEEAYSHTTGNILYVDSDTFFIADPQNYLDKLSPTQSFMHINEYPFSAMKSIELPAGKSFHIFHDFVMNNSFKLSDGTSITVSPHQVSWNAGVIMLHQDHRKLLSDVFSLTDQFHRINHHHGSEQYAFSIILDRNTKVSSCEKMVYHYWVVVKKCIADIFFDSRITHEWRDKSYTAKISDIKKWTEKLPLFMDEHALMLRYNATQSFNTNNFLQGYRYAWRAILKEPLYFKFWKDVAYHAKRNVFFLLR